VVSQKDADHLAAVGVCLWEATAGKEFHALGGPPGLGGFAFAPDGKTLATRQDQMTPFVFLKQG
jgi:hypothetical protein